MRHQLLIGFCETCDAPLIRTATGVCCPQGHGRIIPVPIHVSSGSFPVATMTSRTSRVYTLDGAGAQPGLWRAAAARPSMRDYRARSNARRRPEVRGTDWLVARYGDRLMWLRPVTSPGGSRPPVRRGKPLDATA